MMQSRNAFVLLLTPESRESTWVFRELNFAADNSKPILPIRFEEFELKGKIKLLIGPLQSVVVKRNNHIVENSEGMVRALEAIRRLCSQPASADGPRPMQPEPALKPIDSANGVTEEENNERSSPKNNPPETNILYGTAYAYGLYGMQKNLDKALVYLEYEANERENVEAKIGLGRIYREEFHKNPESFKWYCEAAENGSVEAMYVTGGYYANGVGVKQDYIQARIWYQRAADEGNHTDAMIALGNLYYDGLGGPPDQAHACGLYQQAADLGNASAMYSLGVCYDTGNGVEQSDEKAFAWYLKSAEGGDAGGMNMVGWAYHNGKGTQKDDELSRQWLRKAAEAGNSEAAQNLLDFFNETILIE